MPSMDGVFKALADPTRRAILDRLHREAGQTLGEIGTGLRMTRQGVSKHLAVLEQAGLVVAERVGREKHHYLNPMPIQEISARWIHKFEGPRVAALQELKSRLERSRR
jgi:DNA-binding transcriptional ArsR family regulator